jgi:hypothetical protein
LQGFDARAVEDGSQKRSRLALAQCEERRLARPTLARHGQSTAAMAF